MRIKNFIFIAVLALSMTAKADEIKRPDSYNYQKGCEAATNGRFEEGMRMLWRTGGLSKGTPKY